MMDPARVARYREAEERLWNHYGVAPREHRLRLPAFDAEIRVLELGQGPPVLFVHGSPNAASKWAPLASQLTAFRCLLLERPGCGLSEPVDYRGLDLRRFSVELLGQTLDGLGVASAAVVASSLGGACAFFFAHAHPERVSSLIQEGCPALVEGFHVPFYNLATSAMSALFGVSPTSRAAFRKLGHAASIDHGGFAMEVLTWRDALLEFTDTTRHENSLNRHLATRMQHYRYGITLLSEIKPATLYLWGDDDPFGGPELGRRMAAAQPHARLRSFPGSGHLPWLDDPKTHAHLVGSFLRGEMI